MRANVSLSGPTFDHIGILKGDELKIRHCKAVSNDPLFSLEGVCIHSLPSHFPILDKPQWEKNDYRYVVYKKVP